jgi:hypothetical protein
MLGGALHRICLMMSLVKLLRLRGQKQREGAKSPQNSIDLKNMANFHESGDQDSQVT